MDTGADVSLLTEEICTALSLHDSPAGTALVRGLGVPAEHRVLCDAIISIGDHAIAVSVDCREDLNENILGRDVINEFDLTLCAKRGEVNFKWID